MENKRKICELLLQTLQATDKGRDIVSLEYCTNEFTDDAHVDVTYAYGYIKRVDVTADSGFAMIRDIIDKIS